jgi:hypothetical protein
MSIRLSEITGPIVIGSGNRFAIDTDGNVSVNAGFRNAIINGNFDIWQRGTNFTTTGDTYTADRWLPESAGGINLTIARSTDTPSPDVAFSYVATVNTAVFSNLASQRIESVRTFSGGTVTLSFWAKSNRAQSVSSLITQSFGSGGSAGVNIILPNFTLTTSWQKFSFTVSLPSVAGKTIGAGDHLRVLLLRSGSFQAGDTAHLSQVQLEPGPIATPFERRPIATELALCQRYYYRNDSGRPGMGLAFSATAAQFVVSFPVSMRVNPVALDQSGVASDYTVFRSGAAIVVSNAVPTLVVSGRDSACVQMAFASGLVSGEALMMRLINNAHLGFTAEL